MTKITDLQDARALKAMGVPLNTPVEEAGELPERCDQMIPHILGATVACREAVYTYAEKLNARTMTPV